MKRKLLLVAGLVVAGGGYGRAAEIYGPASDRWALAGSLHDGRSDAAATLLPDARVLVVGGHGGSMGIIATAEFYDPGTGRWSRAASMRIPRWLHTATLLGGGTVLVAGGSNLGTGWPAQAERFDPAANRWQATAEMPTWFIEQHRGRIELASSANGARVTVTIPPHHGACRRRRSRSRSPDDRRVRLERGPGEPECVQVSHGGQ